MTAALGIAACGLGLFLLLRPAVWWRLNSPQESKGKTPDARTLRGVRMRGLSFALGGLALLAVQLYRLL